MYIVIEIQTNIDGTVGNLVYAYQDRQQAERQYHLILAAAAISGLPVHAAVMLRNDGSVIEHQAYYNKE
jgi:hypothetical protein